MLDFSEASCYFKSLFCNKVFFVRSSYNFGHGLTSSFCWSPWHSGCDQDAYQRQRSHANVQGSRRGKRRQGCAIFGCASFLHFFLVAKGPIITTITVTLTHISIFFSVFFLSRFVPTKCKFHQVYSAFGQMYLLTSRGEENFKYSKYNQVCNFSRIASKIFHFSIAGINVCNLFINKLYFSSISTLDVDTRAFDMITRTPHWVVWWVSRISWAPGVIVFLGVFQPFSQTTWHATNLKLPPCY